jgi:hypothetical protein
MTPPESPDDRTPGTSSRRRFLGATAAAATGGLAGCTAPFIRVDTTERTVERRFDAAAVDRLRVDGATDDVRAERAGDDAVRVRAHKTAHGGTTPADLELRSRMAGGTLHLETRTPTGVGIGGGSIDLELAVPPSVAVERLDTADGDVTATGVAGDPTAVSGDGKVVLDRVPGAVAARSGDGDVTVRDPGAVRRIRSGDGDVTVTVPAVDGAADVESGDGDVTLRLGDALDAAVEVTTGDGDIAVHGGLDRIETATERRLVGSAGDGTGDLTVRTGDGDVTVERA